VIWPPGTGRGCRWGSLETGSANCRDRLSIDRRVGSKLWKRGPSQLNCSTKFGMSSKHRFCTAASKRVRFLQTDAQKFRLMRNDLHQIVPHNITLQRVMFLVSAEHQIVSNPPIDRFSQLAHCRFISLLNLRNPSDRADAGNLLFQSGPQPLEAQCPGMEVVQRFFLRESRC
jgi:hypothetical protein